MFYEVYFSPATGKWRIRIVTVYMFFFSWSKDVMTGGDANHPLQAHEFDTHAVAAAYASMIGLAEAYMLLDRRNGYSAWVQGSGCHGTN